MRQILQNKEKVYLSLSTNMPVFEFPMLLVEIIRNWIDDVNLWMETDNNKLCVDSHHIGLIFLKIIFCIFFIVVL